MIQKGDILLVTFPFSELSGSKLRPAAVLAAHETTVILCFITSQTAWPEDTDIELIPDASNGLKRKSLMRPSKIATLSSSLAVGRLGRLSSTDIFQLNQKLKDILKLNEPQR